jgi:hypothetical protein
MKKPWDDPVKDQPAKPETLAIKGDWQKFTKDMQKLLKPPRETTPSQR